MKHLTRCLFLGLATTFTSLLAPATHAEVRLPKVFGNNMVLQRSKPMVFWGWAEPNETVSIKLGAQTQTARANERGEWKASLPATEAGGPFTITVSGSSTVQFENVMVGEVWLCSGQSNMEMGVGGVRDGKAEIAAADYPNIRLLLVANRWTPDPQTDCEGSWKICSPKTLGEGGWNGFSATAYFFGREVHKQLRVPIGLIDTDWGGTRIESWTAPEGFAAVPALKRESELVQLGDPRTTLHQQRLQQTLDETERWLNSARKAMADKALVPAMPTYPQDLLPPHELQQATALFNGMIHPLCPFTLRGALWYQGESNLGEGMLYFEKMTALIRGWRQIWNEGDFPFYFVQIAPFNYGGNAERMGEFWEAQAAAATTIPNCGMAVINDIGDLKDIHPANKQEVGRRLALLALAKTYGRNDVVSSGPTYEAMAIEGDKLRVTFANVAGGLSSRNNEPLAWFELIDADEGGFVKADAKIEGSSVVLSSSEVKHPVAMRFAWSMLAEPNLVNSAGLPAGAFRAGTVPKRDLLTMKVPEAKEYQLVYDLDLNKLGPDITYERNDCAKINRAFDRVAYFLELTPTDGNTQYLYVSMDAFTQDLTKLGVPTVKSGARFQQDVGNLTVYSNARGVSTGTGLAGNIEFWPNNYGPANSAKVPNASEQVWDFGDDPSEPADGYGSMQVHNHAAKQTLFSLNHWREGKGADVGIGNQPKGNPDWTFAANAGSYPAKRLRVLVRPK